MPSVCMVNQKSNSTNITQQVSQLQSPECFFFLFTFSLWENISSLLNQILIQKMKSFYQNPHIKNQNVHQTIIVHNRY